MTKPTLPGDPNTARLAEQQMEELRAEIERLKAQLAAQAPVVELTESLVGNLRRWLSCSPFLVVGGVGCAGDDSDRERFCDEFCGQLDELLDAHAEMEKGDV